MALSYARWMHGASYLDSLVFRQVEYRYRRHTFRFDLSQSLFSSGGVDSGTHLLLAMLAEELDFERYDRYVDVGCGAGTLGLSLAGSAARPLAAFDRDARGVAFTERNARINGLDGVDVETGLVVPAYGGDGRELVVSNVPAKVGEPVLELLVRQMARRATLSTGDTALVIVKPLAEFLSAQLAMLGASVHAERRTANHFAVLFSCPLPPEETTEPELPSEFLRTTEMFPGPVTPYRMETAYNLPEFDGLSYRTALAFDLLRANEVAGEVAAYGCGQGHLAMGLVQRSGKDLRLILADRDLLALRTTARNLKANAGIEARFCPVPTPASLVHEVESGSVGWLVVDDDPTPGSGWNEEIAQTADRVLSDSGKLLLVSRSTTVGRFEKHARSLFREAADRRMRGFRAVLLRRRR